ncbi:hypothetical protein [Allocoleopsis franciscana]|uniref:Uncharacterized protein n=1 Tax=Allocoleopsis franciscana PCC 7113 TaxID=1173027 RepID=K9WLF5_9CYAN|nr:hypothetical protein [Allocoleopsis franciscana]AFZ20626.1 hypothetical protein Mic7113_4965 [Allocoleopsis franciscana PCC 7113]
MKLGVLWRNLGNSTVYYPKLAKVTGGATASILFCQLFHWQSQLSHPDQWVRMTLDEIEKETGLSRLEQEWARSQLIERSLLKERLVKGHSDTLEFWPDIDNLEQRLNDFYQESYNNQAFLAQEEIPLQKPNLSELPLENNLNSISSQITTEAFVEVVVPKEETIENPSYSPKNYTSSSHTYEKSIEESPSPSRIVKTDKFFPVRRQPVAVKVTPHYQFSGPWESGEQFEEFQRALLEHFKQQGVNNPGGWVFRIVDGMTKGLVSPFWDEFVAGMPLGQSQKVQRDWEIEPGIPYPAFEEERTQYYLQKGEPLEVAVSKARSDLRNPVLGQDLWEGFLRKCDRIADEAIKAKQLGVSIPYLPPSFTPKPPVTKQGVMNKLSEITPQLSLSSSSNSSIDQSLEHKTIEDESSKLPSNAPPITALQEAYKTPMGRTLVKRQIAEHPEWGYGIVDGQVVDVLPF